MTLPLVRARLEKLFYPSMHLLIGLISGAELDFHMIGFTAERVYGMAMGDNDNLISFMKVSLKCPKTFQK